MKELLCAIVGLTLVAQTGAAQSDALASAREMAAQGQQADALQAVERVLAGEPDSADALFLKGVVLAGSGRQDEALQLFLDLTRRYPEYPEPFNNLAVLYAERGDYERAVEILKQALQTHSSYRAAYENLTKVYGKLASRAYDRALGQESSTPSAGPGLQLLADLGARSAPSNGPTPTVAVREPRPPAPITPAEPLPGPAASRPATPVAPSEPLVEFDAAAVVAVVQGWARAWSEQQVDDYLGFYAREFAPNDGMSRSAWAEQRAERIRRPRQIEVRVDSIAVRQAGEGRAQARFEQFYRSDRFQDRVSKTLDLVLEGGVWKIQAEQASVE